MKEEWGRLGSEAGGKGAREESIRRRQSPSSGRRALHNRIEHNDAKQYYTTLLGAMKTLTAVEDKHAIVPRHEGIEQGAK